MKVYKLLKGHEVKDVYLIKDGCWCHCIPKKMYRKSLKILVNSNNVTSIKEYKDRFVVHIS